MSRIQKMYEVRFRAALQRLNARRPDQGVQELVAKARQRSAGDSTSLTRALADIHERLQRQGEDFAARNYPLEFKTTSEELTGSGARGSLHLRDTRSLSRFLCDAGLGGLARWLRAAGYEAIWIPDIDDAELIRQTQRLNATLLTTDSLLMERGVLRDGVIPAFWLPPTVTIEEQLAMVFREFGLCVREPRCMSCGGELRQVDKKSVWDRIPPRTRLWLNDYFVCGRCSQLFWHGTHWRRIGAQLRTIFGGGPPGAVDFREGQVILNAPENRPA